MITKWGRADAHAFFFYELGNPIGVVVLYRPWGEPAYWEAILRGKTVGAAKTAWGAVAQLQRQYDQTWN